MKTSHKIITLPTLKRHLRRLRAQGKKIAFTNGCFDILHYGHVCYLEAAKTEEGVLIVGLNSDSSVRRIKGLSRPINSQKMRAAVLAALECVDFVVIFNAETPHDLIKALRPDVLIKGADWKDKEVVGSDIVKAYGGRVQLVRYVPGFSTTRILERLNCCGKG